MSLIVDKRFLPKNQTSDSRQKFIDRYKGAIKSKIREIIQKSPIDKFNKGNKRITINSDDLETPSFEFEPGSGNKDRVYIGNKKFVKGDKARRPQGGQGRSQGGGNGGGGEDEFEFVLTEKEFTDLFFDDLALPNFTKKEFLGSCFEIKHAGFSSYGGPSSLNIKKTMLNALGRRIALKSKEERELKELLDGPPAKKKIQYIEDIDLKYNFKDKIDVPVSKAVMVCIMDVSGSMGEKEKDLAKRFFILLNMFLRRNYEIVDVVFIRHAETAGEVDEDTFFHGRISGGTIISSGYEEADKIIKARYNPEQWNIYIAQASDGDNFESDMEPMETILVQKLLPITQYFAYVDIASCSFNMMLREMCGQGSLMLRRMKELMKSHQNLQAKEIKDYADIFPVFRSLFKKKEGK